MPVITYKCPNCGGELTFDPETGQYRCEYCLSSFSPEEAEKANAEPEKETKAVLYTCPNCGAEIVTDETTAATFCFYCHNPVILTGRLSGEYLPDEVLPFTISREQAVEQFFSVARKKKFLPRGFFDKEQVKKMTGVYFPYWIYGGMFSGEYRARGRKIRIWRTGDIEYTETSTYHVERDGTMEISGLAENALKKADRELLESVQPYRLEERKPFSYGYLSGFQAEKRDVEQKEVEEELKGERNAMVKNVLQNEASEYGSLEQERVSVHSVSEQWKYVLLPVWLLTYPGGDGKIYYFAMNGQTGKINGEFPMEKGKAVFAAVAVGLLVFVLMMVGGYFL